MYSVEQNSTLQARIDSLIAALGSGQVGGVAYDTAWIARLVPHYPGHGFEAALDWLRAHQHSDGTWGGELPHHHDRFISTLAAIIALTEVGNKSEDKHRVQRGENALWKVVGKIAQDDSDTIGFPILSVSLAEEANALGLDVPLPPIRFAEPYRRKVQALLAKSVRDWRQTPLLFSLEALRTLVKDSDVVLEDNHSAGISLSATAGYLLTHYDQQALSYIHAVFDHHDSGSAPALSPIDIFEITWSLTFLRAADAVDKDDPEVKRVLDYLWKAWTPEVGVSHSSHFTVTDIDDTAACFVILRWGGYPVSADVFRYYEMDDHFVCYRGETNLSISAHVRLLAALRLCEDEPSVSEWIAKALGVLRRWDENGTFWWDKWHASPYYVNSAALSALYGIADDLALSRLKWILRTQNDDGGWGYLGKSTAEETAYCLLALLWWDDNVSGIDPMIITRAGRYLQLRLDSSYRPPLWIGKTLYTPVKPVEAAILAALHSFERRSR